MYQHTARCEWWFASGLIRLACCRLLLLCRLVLSHRERARCPSTEGLGSGVTGECISRRAGELRWARLSGPQQSYAQRCRYRTF